MVKGFVLIGLVLLVSNCSRPAHPEATKLCRCYDEIRLTADVERGNRLFDSCAILHKEILRGLDDESLGHFLEAFDECRSN